MSIPISEIPHEIDDDWEADILSGKVDSSVVPSSCKSWITAALFWYLSGYWALGEQNATEEPKGHELFCLKKMNLNNKEHTNETVHVLGKAII